MGLRTLLVLGLVVALTVVHPVAAETVPSDAKCQFANAAGPTGGGSATGGGAGKKKRKRKRQKLTLQADPQSANRVVNLGDDREAEEVTLRVNASPRLLPGAARQLEVAAEPFVNSSETGETVSFSEPTFTRLIVSGNRKRITFAMCVDPPNDLPAGKYAATVMMEGPPNVEEAVMTVTLNAKDGHGFIIAAMLTALLAFLILLYKGASEKRALLLAEAQDKPAGDRDAAVREACRWRPPIGSCLLDLGWLVPTLASIAAAFALLYAAYDSNPAWGEGGIVTSAIALIGTGLAAVGAKAVFTQSPPTR